MRLCKGCNESKEETDFHKNASRKDGLATYCKPCNIARGKKYYENNKERQLELRYIRNVTRHGITVEVFEKKLADQGGVCYICEESENVTFVIDHDHKCCSGQFGCEKCFRGVLCTRCNLALGIFQDSEVRLQKAIQYLRG